MNVLGISGGTKNGNNDAMCREALKGAQENGAEIEFIRLFDLDLKPCTGCIACVNQLMQGKPSKCVIKDDFAWLSDKLLDADAVIFTIPIFEKSAAAIFRILQDRFAGPANDRGMNTICRMIAEKNGNPGPDMRLLKDKFVSFIAIGGSDWSTRISCDFNLFALVPIWKVIDDVTFQWSKGIVMDDVKVKQCNEVGVNIANALKNPEKAEFMGDTGICPHCHSRNFYLNDGADSAICCMCGIIGEIKSENGKISFIFPEEQVSHAHDTLSGKLLHAQDIGKYEGMLNEIKKTPEFIERMDFYKNFIQATVPER